MQNKLNVPTAIIIAGVIVAAAILMVGSGGGGARLAQDDTQDGVGGREQAADTDINIAPVTEDDHIRGEISAPVKIVEFSDLECPFCARFHSTMQRIIEEYEGEVAWIYRHFPLDSLHSKARIEAAASELAAELGGNDAFWAYIDRLFEVTPSNDRLSLSELAQIAEDIGLPREPFEELVAEDDRRGGKFADKIEAHYQDAIASGGSGTPYSVIITASGKTFPLSGAQPYENVKAAIGQALAE